jgi:uncharacterized membrane protein HdeD (DUF308 family)
MWTKNWGWIVARGVFAVLFGLVALFLPGLTWLALMAVFAAYAFLDGVASLVTALGQRPAAERRWGMLVVEGIAGIAVAVLLVIWPIRTSIAFLYVLGAWGVVTGALEIAAAIRLRRVIRREWMLALAGVLSIAFGVVVWLWPAAGALALVWWIGAYAIVFGGLLIALGVRLRRLGGGRDERGVHVGAEIGQTT